MPHVYLMLSFESTQNFQQGIANHSSQVLEVAGGDFFTGLNYRMLIKES